MSTLELDTQITKDQKVVVNHDRQISSQKCQDTGPAFPGDPSYPYVGKYIKDLTLAEIKTMDCGYQQLPDFPQQEQVKGFRMVELKDVLNLVKAYHAKQVKLNIETKVEAGSPSRPPRATCSSAGSSRRSTPPASSARSRSSPSTGAHSARCTSSRPAGRWSH